MMPADAPRRRSRTRLFALPVFFVVAYGLYAAVYAIYSRPPAGPWTFAASFESGTLDELSLPGMRQLCCDHSAKVVASPLRDGHRAVRVQLDAMDPLVRTNHRAEFRFPSTRLGSENDYVFSIFVPADWSEDSCATIVAQWHAVPDRWWGEAFSPSPLQLELAGGEWQLSCAWDERPVIRFPFQRGEPRHHIYPLRLPLEKGRWTDWAFQVRWAYDRTGILRVSKDGRDVLRRDGPNTYNDLIGPYFKFGIYVPGWSGVATDRRVASKVVDFDAIEVSQGR